MAIVGPAAENYIRVWRRRWRRVRLPSNFLECPECGSIVDGKRGRKLHAESGIHEMMAAHEVEDEEKYGQEA